MKIDSKKLSGFLTKATINGEIIDGILQFKEDGLKLTLKDSANVCIVESILNKSCFTDYEIQDIPIKSNKKIIDILKTIDGIIEITMENNFLYVTSAEMDAHFAMPSQEFVENHIETIPNLELDEGFMVNSSFLKNSTKNFGTMNSNSMTINITDNKLNISLHDNSDTIIYKASATYKNVIASYGEMFLKVISLTDGMVNLALNDNYPLRIIEKTVEYEIKTIIAPIVTEE